MNALAASLVVSAASLSQLGDPSGWNAGHVSTLLSRVQTISGNTATAASNAGLILDQLDDESELMKRLWRVEVLVLVASAFLVIDLGWRMFGVVFPKRVYFMGADE